MRVLLSQNNCTCSRRAWKMWNARCVCVRESSSLQLWNNHNNKSYDFMPSHAMQMGQKTLSHTTRVGRRDRERARDWLAWHSPVLQPRHAIAPRSNVMCKEKQRIRKTNRKTLNRRSNATKKKNRTAAVAVATSSEPTKFICIDEVQLFFAVSACLQCIQLNYALHLRS